MTNLPWWWYRSSQVVWRAMASMASMTPGHRSKALEPFGSKLMMSPMRVISSMSSTFSKRVTEWPLRSHSIAADSPANPAPTTMTLIPEGGRRGKLFAILCILIQEIQVPESRLKMGERRMSLLHVVKRRKGQGHGSCFSSGQNWPLTAPDRAWLAATYGLVPGSRWKLPMAAPVELPTPLHA